ncbi:thermopsin [Saccharolobus islandicus]|uniref:Thermopsin n=2 Tax=Saccharolobus islandicus TaxID=43080 RepID=C3MVT5_SACI4|nr:thermopsin family protease [Sulfolobus islandicus]ACP37522.1 Thermopsin [Sulfolobus islandicus M.14.25]
MRLINILLLAMLFLPIFSFFTLSMSLADQIQIPPHYYFSISYNVTQGNGIDVIFYASSPITFMIMTPSQFYQFNQTDLSQSIYSTTTNSLSRFFPLKSGQYYIVFYNNISNNLVTLNYYILSRPLPTGIADYGLKVNNSVISPYIEKIKSVIGAVEINKLLAYNLTPPAGISQYSASIQLNVVLQVNTIGGSQQIWLQNVIQIDTNNNFYSFLDNIWNFTGKISILSNSTVKGNGIVYVTNNGNDYYAYGTNFSTLLIPSLKYLLINTSYTSQGPMISFGYMNQSGSPIWYDNVTILIPNTLSAYILVDGYNFTAGGLAYDAELILGGGGNGEFTFFNESNVELAMIYQYLNGTLAPPKFLFPFGLDTEESADNLYTVSYNGVYLATNGYQVINNLNENVSQLRFNVVNYTKATDQNFPYIFTINVSGGVLPYKLNVTISNSSGNELSGYTYVLFPSVSTYYLPLTPLSPSNYTVKIKLIDFNGNSKSYKFPLTINPPLKVQILNVTNYTDLVLPYFNFTSIISGGTKPYNITITISNDSGILSETYKIINYTSVAYYTVNMKGYSIGKYTIQIEVKDYAGSINISKYNFTINPNPYISTLVYTNETDKGLRGVIKAIGEGGSGSLIYYWYVNNSLVSSGIGDELYNFTPSNIGEYNITIMVKDVLGISSAKSVIIKVNPDPVAELSVPKTVIDSGAEFPVNVTVSLGTPPYYTSWYINGSYVGNGSIKELNLSNIGVYIITVTVRDSASYIINISKSVSIVPPPSLSVKEQTQGNFIQYNTSIALSASVNGGTNPYYLIFLNGKLVGNYSSTTQLQLKLQNGENNITLVAKDLWGKTAVKTLIVNSGYNYVGIGIIVGIILIIVIIVILVISKRK